MAGAGWSAGPLVMPPDEFALVKWLCEVLAADKGMPVKAVPSDQAATREEGSA
jgi:hypothetical protein